MTIIFDENNVNWQKMKGLIPAVVQDVIHKNILMLGYMTKEALVKTIQTGQVTFYSRSQKKLWTKGETSGNFLKVCEISTDCDQDALLILAKPSGPTCHLGDVSCFAKMSYRQNDFISMLERTIEVRQKDNTNNSYVASLMRQGINRISQKVGEEGLEVALAAVSQNKEQVCEEAADLVFHLLVLLRAKGLGFNDVLAVLAHRASK